jgi:Ca2+/H+ antiporter, TMEM165/GDT1 family
MLEAFTAGLLLITVSELGDKTFFIAVILAMRYSRLLVFLAVLTALALMTVISVLFGQVVSLLPAIYIKYAEIALFWGFGGKLIYDGLRMEDKSPDAEVAEEIVDQSVDQPLISQGKFVSFWHSPMIKLFIQGFSMTFLAEWGDRTQIATIALAAAKNPWGVALGAICGHAICTVIAVFGGRFIAGKISEKTITMLGGGLFLIFGGVAIAEIL